MQVNFRVVFGAGNSADCHYLWGLMSKSPENGRSEAKEASRLSSALRERPARSLRAVAHHGALFILVGGPWRVGTRIFAVRIVNAHHATVGAAVIVEDAATLGARAVAQTDLSTRTILRALANAIG